MSDSSLARTQRYRARQRAGLGIFTLRLPTYAIVNALIASERLTVAEALNPLAVEHALAELLVDWAIDTERMCDA